MIDRNLNNVIDLLKSVGVKGCLDDDDRSAFVRKDWINRRHKKFWKPIAESLSKSDLENLFRGLVIAERELKWLGGSGASAIWIFHVYQKRFEDASIELANWALTNRGRNSYIPFGGRTDVNSYDEWIIEKKLKKQRIAEHNSHQRSQREEKFTWQKKHLDLHEARILNGKNRAFGVKNYNERLSAYSLDNQLRIIAHSDMPLESVDNELLDQVLCDFPSLDTKTISILLEKIDRRDRGSWGRIKQALLSRSMVGVTDFKARILGKSPRFLDYIFVIALFPITLSVYFSSRFSERINAIFGILLFIGSIVFSNLLIEAGFHWSVVTLSFLGLMVTAIIFLMGSGKD